MRHPFELKKPCKFHDPLNEVLFMDFSVGSASKMIKGSPLRNQFRFEIMKMGAVNSECIGDKFEFIKNKNILFHPLIYFVFCSG